MKWFNFIKALFGKIKREQELLDENFINFTPRARQGLALARLEADRLNHNYIGTEHVLLGLIKLGQGVAVNVVLGRLGVNLGNVRAEVEQFTGIGPEKQFTGKAPYTPRVKKVLAYARDEARALKHTYIGTEHILLGLLREGEGIAAQALRNLGVDTQDVRTKVLQELDPNFSPADETQKEVVEMAPESLPKRTWQKGAGADSQAGFTPRAHQVLAFASEEADRLHHNYLGVEHLLLGLLRLDLGVAAICLKASDLHFESVRAEVEELAGIPSGKMIGHIPYTPRMRLVVEMAGAQAKLVNHTYIGTDHLLLALLLEKEGLAAEIFKKHGVDLEQLRKSILKALDPNFSSEKDDKNS